MNNVKETARLRFNQLLQEYGEKLNELSESIHIGSPVLSRYKMGKTPIPLDALVAICEHYDVSADWMLGLTEERQKKKETYSASWLNEWGRKHGMNYGEASAAASELLRMVTV